MEIKTITTQMLKRLPLYLNYLKSISQNETINISATTIAHELKLNDVQVRKDLALISGNGRPKIGYNRKNLIFDLEHCLGYDNTESVVLIGAGNLGRALLTYEGFSDYGMDIIAAFDIDESIVGTVLHNKQILSLDKLPSVCSRMKIKIGILAVRAEEAQNACNLLVDSGILAIWNFAPVHLLVPQQVVVKNENLGSSLAILSNYLVEKIKVI